MGGRSGTWAGAVLLLLVSAVLLPSCGTDPEAAQWQEGTEHGPWRVVYNGHGTVVGQGGTITLSPRPARRADETHAALVISKASYEDFTYRLRMRTVKQLREPGRPNPWEAAWAVWHYTDDTHFYYVVLKPNGWELGKVDPACPEKQCFLATHPGSYPIHSWHTVEVHQRGATMTISVDDEPIVTHTDRRGPYTRGSVGLYTEDATVEFEDISVRGRG
ncbi:family 16 glycoside hydrolase [Streptomyces sp. CB03234]|uniref:family 16 glycoside hydrolase n=1 Tax=Streptomyces sp. (strain CB03234) TaxID=1703937 RepID=UPI0009389148|nr:family 16 glycoside hydrolase [Streptomyces sp. CB03234]